MLHMYYVVISRNYVCVYIYICVCVCAWLSVYINYHKLRLKGSSSLLMPFVFSTISMLHLWWISRDQKNNLSLSP